MIRTIIDAYNLIFQCGLQPKTLNSPTALHRARQRLIDELADRIESGDRKEVMLVFDAKNPRGHSTPELDKKGFGVAFAREYEDADAMLIELMQQHSQPKQLTVVSSDHRVQTAASRRNAKPIDADHWFDRLQSPGRREATSHEEGPSKDSVMLSEAETQQLVERFSDFNPDATTSESATSEDNDRNAAYNPFPPGYGEDLLE